MITAGMNAIVHEKGLFYHPWHKCLGCIATCYSICCNTHSFQLAGYIIHACVSVVLSYYIHALTCSQAVPRGPTPAKILYEILKSQNFWQNFGFLAFHFKDILFIFVVLSFK